MVVSKLRFSLCIFAVPFSSSSHLVTKIPFYRALSTCCSLQKVQVLARNNEWITIFSMSKECNGRKYLFIFFTIARSQLDASDSSLSLCFFCQCVATRSLPPTLLACRNKSNDFSYFYKNQENNFCLGR